MTDQLREPTARRFRIFVGVITVVGVVLVGWGIVAANRAPTGEGAAEAAVFIVLGAVLLLVALIAAIAWSLRPRDR